MMEVDFEVFGKVQGVFFRKYTQAKALALGVTGWCMNTNHGTVRGTLCGPPEKVLAMKEWLQNVGSPKSKIEKVIFSNEQRNLSLKNDNNMVKFEIRK